jgi:hypothetical protein
MTIGLPGTGISWAETVPSARAAHAGHGLALTLVIAAALLSRRSHWPKRLKSRPAAVLGGQPRRTEGR